MTKTSPVVRKCRDLLTETHDAIRAAELMVPEHPLYKEVARNLTAATTVIALAIQIAKKLPGADDGPAWQPIQLVPKDGTRVHLRSEDVDPHELFYWGWEHTTRQKQWLIDRTGVAYWLGRAAPTHFRLPTLETMGEEP